MGKVELRDASKDVVLRQEMFDFFVQQVPRYAPILDQLCQNGGEHQINVACLNGGEIIGGTIGGHLEKNTSYLNFYFVTSNQRQKRIGSLLLKDFETRVTETGRKRVECLAGDEISLQWFINHGYKYQDRELKAVAMNPQRLKNHFRVDGRVSLYKTF